MLENDCKFYEYPSVMFNGIYPKDYSEAIEWAGRQSTDTQSNGESKIFTKARVKEGHLSLLRFVTAHFEIYCSRDTSMQMLRHKFLDFCQLSQRYSKQKPYFIIPPNFGEDESTIYKNSCVVSYHDYEKLLSCKKKKEDARFVLPGASMTSMAVTMNIQAARDFLNLRLSKKAQLEIRTIAVLIGDYLLGNCPELVFDLEEKIQKTIDDLKVVYGDNRFFGV